MANLNGDTRPSHSDGRAYGDDLLRLTRPPNASSRSQMERLADVKEIEAAQLHYPREAGRCPPDARGWSGGGGPRAAMRSRHRPRVVAEG
ncbi:hypothetical protein PI125_g14222 [Phytophthora idaei]|nr:hypothetical protein PI125_g14222 [Phytophthora idaei]